MDMLFSGLAQTLHHANTIEQLIRPLLEMLSDVTGMESTYLTSIELERQLQTVDFSRNTGTLQIPEGTEVNWCDTLCRRSVDTQISFTNKVEELWGDSDAARLLGIKSYMSAPIHTSAGVLVGTLCAASSQEIEQHSNADNLIKIFARIVGNFIERELLVEQLQSMNQTLQEIARTDALTDLPNRRALLEILERMLAQALRQQTCLLIGVIDLDGFKRINDELGHHTGDLFLSEIARRLSACLRATDVVGRLGGDEFLFIGPGPGWSDQHQSNLSVRQMQLRLQTATAGTYQLAQHRFDYPGASVGVISIGSDTISASDAISLADAAMYTHKKSRKSSRESH